MLSQHNPLRYINLFCEIAGRDIKRKYYRSVLGVIWTMLSPLMMMLILTVVFSTIFKHSIHNFPVYYLCASLIFSFNSDATTQSITGITENAPLIKKIYLPKYVFCLSKVAVSFITMLCSFIALIVVMIITGCQLTAYLLFVPILFVLVAMFTAGVSLALASYGVFFKDLRHLYSVAITALTYMTPIFYPIDIVPERFRFIWELNPLYHYCTVMRDLVYLGTIPTMRSIAIVVSFSILTLLLGALIFKEKQDSMMQHI